MLIETKHTRQIPGESFRRWFSDKKINLTVRYSDDRTTVIGFQFCYINSKQEKAITWRHDQGYDHTTCDDGEGQSGKYKMSPILMPDGPFDNQSVLELFHANSGNLEKELVEFISTKIQECPERF